MEAAEVELRMPWRPWSPCATPASGMVAFLARWRRGVDASDPAALVARVLAGDRAAAERLVDRLLPTIQKRVAWVLSRAGKPRRDDVLDHAQDVLLRLFERDYRVLRTWDASRGASLETFVALVTERHVIASLRSGRKSAWREDPTLDVEHELGAGEADLERQLGNKDLLEQILVRLESELTPRSRELFRALFVDERPIDEVAGHFGMSSNAVYTWSSRLRTRVQALTQELGGERAAESL